MDRVLFNYGGGWGSHVRLKTKKLSNKTPSTNDTPFGRKTFKMSEIIISRSLVK